MRNFTAEQAARDASLSPVPASLASKADASHTHDIEDVDGLDAELSSLTSNISTLSSGKAASAHTHAASDIASGTVATARLGSGTANSGSFLTGAQTYSSAVQRRGEQITATLSGNQDNFALSDGVSGLTLVSDGTAVLSGLSGGLGGRFLTIFDLSGGTTIKHEDPASSTANRFSFPSGSDYVMNISEPVLFQYLFSRWRPVATGVLF